MKLDLSAIRSTAKTKEIDITRFVDPEKTGGNSIILVAKKLTVRQRDENSAWILRKGKLDKRTNTFQMTDDNWFHESRVRLILQTIDDKDERFPFERWDAKFIDEIDEVRPDLIEFIYQEVETFNGPLLTESNVSSKSSDEHDIEDTE